MWFLDKLIVYHCVFSIIVKYASLEKTNPNAEYPSVYNIGGVLSGNESETYFATTISVSHSL